MSMEIDDDSIALNVVNHGQASTSNATLQHLNSNGEVTWSSSVFSVNASNTSLIEIDSSNLSLEEDGSWQVYYQIRVIDSARWVTESIEVEPMTVVKEESSNLLIGYGLFNPITIIGALAVVSLFKKDDEYEE